MGWREEVRYLKPLRVSLPLIGIFGFSVVVFGQYAIFPKLLEPKSADGDFISKPLDWSKTNPGPSEKGKPNLPSKER